MGNAFAEGAPAPALRTAERGVAVSDLSESFPSSTVAERAVLVAVSGKVRGSRARLLGERLHALADEGVRRVILDFSTLVSIDSLGTLALEDGLDRGLRLHLVVRPGFVSDPSFDVLVRAKARPLSSRLPDPVRERRRRAVRVHRSLDEALARVRQILDSTVGAG